MAQAKELTESERPTSIVPILGEIGRQRAEAMAAMQTELFDELKEIGQHWTARTKSKTDLASELVSELTSARTVPETAKAFQEWASRRMQMALEDGQIFFADSCKLTEIAARNLSNCGSGKPPDSIGR